MQNHNTPKNYGDAATASVAVDRDAIWNAAIEAAAGILIKLALNASHPSSFSRGYKIACDNAQSDIRALRKMGD